MPPTMGAAILRMTSEPVPPPNMIGRRPAMMEVASVGGLVKQYQVVLDPDRLRELGSYLRPNVLELSAHGSDDLLLVGESGQKSFV